MRRYPSFILLIGLALLGLWSWRRSMVHADGRGPLAKPDSSAVSSTAGAPAVRVPAVAPDAGSATERVPADARSIIASAWLGDARPKHAAFRDWTRRYLAAAPDVRPAFVAEGLRLAEARRGALAALIVADPEAALASAVPVAVRSLLPEEIVARLESRVSGRGELALVGVTPAPGASRPDEPVFRAALIDGVEYRAYVYGRRAAAATLPSAALVGIAVDRALAVTDSSVRLLEPGEPIPPDRPLIGGCAACAARAAAGAAADSGRIAYEYAGAFGVADNTAHLDADVAAFDAADNQPGSVSVAGRPSQAWTHGEKKILLIRVDFSDLAGVPLDAGTPITESYAVQRFTGGGGVAAFFAASSYGKTSLSIGAAVSDDSPDVTPVLRLSRFAANYAKAGDNLGLHADARAAALAAGFNVSSYDRVGVLFSSLASLTDSKITYGGLGSIIGTNFWINGAYTFRVVAHELGHTFGLRHANLWKVTDGNPVSESGHTDEYGDPIDLMGGGEFLSSMDDFSQWNKSLLQWIPDTAVTVAEASGTYRVHRFDHASADLALPRALKIVRDPTRDYWIGYRRATSNASFDNGAYVVWGYNNNQQGDLLDLTTPGTNPDDAALAIGSTLNDTAVGITLKPVAQGGSGADEWIDVQVTIGARVQWVASVLIADEQRGSATLMLRRTGNTSAPLSVAYATEPGVATVPADYTHVSGTVSWAAGDIADKTVVVPLVADGLVEGTEPFVVRLGAVTGGVRVGPAAATVTIADAGARDTSFTAAFINSSVQSIAPLPGGGLVAGGFFSLANSPDVGRNGILRLLPDGAFDESFDPGTGLDVLPVRDLAVQADGRVVLVGNFTTYAGAARLRVARANGDGSLDPSFNPGAGANNVVRTVLIQPDGCILLGGEFTSFNGQAREYLVRLLPNGATDTSFNGPNFADASDWRVESLALQPDGRIVVGGSFYFSGSPFKAGICRLLPNGALDSSFNGVSQGTHVAGDVTKLRSVKSIVIQPDGKILIGGDFTAFNNVRRVQLARLTSSGGLDTSFAPGEVAASGIGKSDDVFTLCRQPDGKVIYGGAFTYVNPDPDGSPLVKALFGRVNGDGSADATFAAVGVPAGSIQDMALTGDGRLWIAGAYASLQGSPVSRPVWRILPGLAGAAGVVEFSTDAYFGSEGRNVTITARRLGGSLGVIRVGYAVARGLVSDIAAPGFDYLPPFGFLEWADGDTADKTIVVPLLPDALNDGNETFTVRLGEPVIGGAGLGARREAVVTIDPVDAQTQLITFAPLPDISFDPAPRPLAASASSGLPVAFEVVSGPATVDDSVLTLTGAGVVTVRATQPGDMIFDAAAPVERSFTVSPASQTITFPAPPNRALSSGAFTLDANSSSGLAVGFELVSGPAQLSGSVLTPTALGTVVVRAVQAGDANVLAAEPVERSFHITKSATVSFSNPVQPYSGAPREITVTTDPPGLAVSVTYDGSPTPPTEAGSYQVVGEVMDDSYTALGCVDLVVTPAPLLVGAEPVFKLLNAPVPVLKPVYSGFVGGDTAAVLDQAPAFATTATAKSKLGAYPITITGGADANYTITRQNGTLTVVTLAGSYETLLHDPDTGDVIGLARVTVSADQKKFTGVLEVAAETASISVSGTISAPAGTTEGVVGAATSLRKPKDLPAYAYRLVVEPYFSEFAATLYRDEVKIAEGLGVQLQPPTLQNRTAFAGAYTLRFSDFAALDEADLRAVPAGSGYATATVAKNGTLALSGRLPDGRALSGSLGASAVLDGDYRYFTRPYGARAQSYLAGLVRPSALAGNPGPLVLWRKAAKPATAAAEPCPDGFSLAGLSELRRWVAPTAATKTVAATTLVSRLGLAPESAAALAVGYSGAPLGATTPDLPAAAGLNSAGVVTAVGGTAATKWNLKVTPASGLVTGSFVLTDAVPVPNKADKIVKRTIAFKGVLRQPDAAAPGADPLVGFGNYLVVPLATGGPILSGEIELLAPAP